MYFPKVNHVLHSYIECMCELQILNLLNYDKADYVVRFMF